jgi:hypothetical protein
MGIRDYELESQYYLSQAAQLLGCPGRPVRLDHDTRTILQKRLIYETQVGLGAQHPVLGINAGKHGHHLDTGIVRYRLAGTTIRVVLIFIPMPHWDFELWAVPAHQLRQFYRYIRIQIRNRLVAEPPVMHQADWRRVWNGTIGFLRHDQAVLEKYGVARKRGVLFWGPPGNGKTMTCRFLRWRSRGFHWKTISSETFHRARMRGETDNPLESPRGGIVVFDDLTPHLLDEHRATILSALDGIDACRQTVFIFTSNHPLREFGDAFGRPGRVDCIVEFPKPDAELRRRFMENWHADIREGIDLERAIDETDGTSFAELEEIKASGADICEGVVGVLSEYGLVPKSFEEEKADVEPQSGKIVIHIRGETAYLVRVPREAEIIVRNYDVDGLDAAELETDEEGNRYQGIRLNG